MITSQDFDRQDLPVIPYRKMHEEVDRICDGFDQAVQGGTDSDVSEAVRLVGHLAVDIADSLDSMAAALEEKS